MQKNIDSEIFELMFLLSKTIKEKMVRFSDATNITMSQFMALLFIERRGSVNMKGIADHFSIEMPTATSLVDKLSRQSLVKRTIGKKDRRIVTVTLSKKGEELLIKAQKIQAERVAKMLSYLSDSQKENMKNILTTVIEKVK